MEMWWPKATHYSIIVGLLFVLLVDAYQEEEAAQFESDHVPRAAHNIYDCIDNQINYFPVRVHRHNKNQSRLFYESNSLATTKLALRVQSDKKLTLVPINLRVAESTVIRDSGRRLAADGKVYTFKEIYMREWGGDWLQISFIFQRYERTGPVRLLVLKFMLKEKLANIFPDETLRSPTSKRSRIVTLSSDSLVLEMSSLKNYFEYSISSSVTKDDDDDYDRYDEYIQPACAAIDKINVFTVSSDQATQMNSIKRRAKRSDDDSTPSFTADTTYITNCIIIAIVVAIVLVGLFSMYYFCNRDMMAAIAKKVKFTVMKMFKR